MPPTSPDSHPEAWVLRCPLCLGGLVYALSTPETEQGLLPWLMQEIAVSPAIERGPIDRLWDIDYCTCPKEPPHAPTA